MISALSDLFYSVRNKVLSSERSLRFLSDFPVSRPIAKRESRAAFDLCAGFVYSQVLLACIELRLLDHLAGAFLVIGVCGSEECPVCPWVKLGEYVHDLDDVFGAAASVCCGGDKKTDFIDREKDRWVAGYGCDET